MPGFPRVLAAVADAYRKRRDEVERAGPAAGGAPARAAGACRPAIATPERRAARCRGRAHRRLASTRRTAASAARRSSRAPMTLEFLLRVVAPQPATPATLRDGDASRSTAWPTAASTTSSAAASPATAPTRTGWCRTSRRCCTTTRCSPTPTSRRYRATGDDRYARVARETLDFMLREMRDRRRRLRLGARRRQRGRGGALLRLGSRRVHVAVLAMRASMLTRRGYWPITGALPPRATGRARTSCTSPARPRHRLSAARSRPRRRSWRHASGGCGRVATTSSSPPGTGWRCGRSATRRSCWASQRFAEADARAASPSSATQLLRDGDRLWRTARDGVAHTPGFCEDYADRGRWAAGGARRARRRRRTSQLAAALMATAARATSGTRPSGTLLRHLRRARADRGPAAVADRQRHAVGELGGGRRPPAAGAAHRRAGSRPARAKHPARRGARPRAAAERLRADAVRRRSRARRAVDAVIAGDQPIRDAWRCARRRRARTRPTSSSPPLVRRRAARQAGRCSRARSPRTARRPPTSAAATPATSRRPIPSGWRSAGAGLATRAGASRAGSRAAPADAGCRGSDRGGRSTATCRARGARRRPARVKRRRHQQRQDMIGAVPGRRVGAASDRRAAAASSAASRSSSDPAPSSTTTTPAVACGTKTLSSPSWPAATSATKAAHASVRSVKCRLAFRCRASARESA